MKSILVCLGIVGAVALILTSTFGEERHFGDKRHGKWTHPVARSIEYARRGGEPVRLETAGDLASATDIRVLEKYFERETLEVLIPSFSYDAETETLTHKKSGKRVYVPKS